MLGLQQAPIDASKSDLKRMHEAGLRVIGLEYQNGNSTYGSGWFEPDLPLTNRGKTFIEEVADTGLILDLSHSGDTTASQALDFVWDEQIDVPVMASHGGVNELYSGDIHDFDNRRNLTYETLEKIHKLQGVIGLFALTFSLSATDNSEEPFLHQLEQVNNSFPGSVVIGSDAVYAERDVEEWENTFEFMLRNVAKDSPMKPRFPDTPLELNTPARLTLIHEMLRERGMSKNDAENIVATTLMRFFENNL